MGTLLFSLPLFLCDFFSLDKEKKSRKKRNLRRIICFHNKALLLLKVLLRSFSYKKGCAAERCLWQMQ